MTTSQDAVTDNFGLPAGKETGGPVLLAMGGNLSSDLGSPERTIRHAIGEMVNLGVEVDAVSRLFRTPAFPPGSGPDFVNAAVRCVSGLAPHDLLDGLKEIERRSGRVRHARWGARTLDIDILAIGSSVLPDRETYARWQGLAPEAQRREVPDGLILPHPRLQERGFVLIPLADVAPDWRHPVLGLSVREMLDRLPKDALDGITPITPL